jgi:hypothetical protein
MTSSLVAPFSYLSTGYPGVAGSCGPTLPAGASCYIDVAFAPQSPGTATETLSISYFDGAQTTAASRDLAGKGTSDAFLSITDFPLQYYEQYGLGADPATFAFGAHGLGSTAPHTFYVNNTGAATATGMGGGSFSAPFSFAGAGGAYPGTGGSCQDTLAPGASCTVVVAFAPTNPVSSNATLSVSYDGTGAPSAIRRLAGSGTSAPVLVIQDFDVTDLRPAAWDFGTFGVGVSSTHEFYVLNTGGATALSMFAPAIGTGFGYVGGSYPGAGGTCNTSLAAGSACKLEVVFQPVAVGPVTGNVKVDYHDAGSGAFSTVRVVTGVGTALGLLEIDDDGGNGGGLVSDFGTVGLGNAADRKYTIRNVGGGPVSSLAFAAPGAPFSFAGAGGTYPGTGGDCDTSLQAGASCQIVVSFKPAAAGDFGAVLAATYGDGAVTRSASLTLAGHAIDGAQLSISDWSGNGGNNNGPFDFGSWGVPTDHTFYVTNHGNKPAGTIAGITPAAPFSWKGTNFPGTGGSCTSTALEPGATCTVVVAYSGAATSGGSFGLSYDDGDGHTLGATRAVSGEAIPNALLVITDCNGCGPSSGPADFGTVGTSSTRTFSVLNTGAKTAVMVRDAGLLSGAFTFTGTGNYPGVNGSCSATLDPGATCQIGVTFTPGGPGSFSGTLGVAYDDGTGAALTATRGLVGAKTDQALLTIHNWSATDYNGGGGFDFGTVGLPTDHLFTVTNDGAQTATSMMDGAGLDSGFDWKDGTYPGTGGTCAGSLAPGDACTLIVTFKPSGNGPDGSTLLVRYYDGANTQYAKESLGGTSTTAALLQISDGPSPPTGPMSPGAPPFDYGTIGAPADATFTVTNWGGAQATMVADGGTLGGGFGWTGGVPFGGGDCGPQLDPGKSCTVSVRFTPSGDGPLAATLSISYRDGTVTQVATRALAGTATTKAIVNVYDWTGPSGLGGGPGPGMNPPPFDYGVWGVPIIHTFTLRNDGGGPATMLASGGAMGTGFAWEDGAFPGTTGDCTGMLAVGGTCAIAVTFTPGGPTALYGQVRVSYYDGGATRTAVRAVTGTPTARAHVSVSEYFGPNDCTNCSPFDWGSVTIGGSLEHTFTVYNTGALTATSLMPTASLAAPFSFKGLSGYPGAGGDCGAMLAPNGHCSLVLVFAPQASGLATGTIAVTYDDTFASPLDASRAMQATGK